MSIEPFDYIAKPRFKWVEFVARSVNVVHSPVTGWAVLIFSLFVTFSAYWVASKQVAIRAQQQFEHRAAEIQDAIHDRMMMYEQALKGAVWLFNSSDKVTREEWRLYVESLQLKRQLPGIQGIGYSLYITPENLTAHINQVRSEGFPDYSVLPVGERENYSAIVYLEPFDWRNKRAFGFDMWSNDVRRDAMAKARDTGQANTSGIITLVQETDLDVQKGFLMYLPHYSKHLVLSDEAIQQQVAYRRQHFVGWVYAAFRAQDLMQGILGSTDPGLNFTIYDGDEIQPSTKLYETTSHNFDNAGDSLSLIQKVVLQGRQWTIQFEGNTAALLGYSQSNQPFYVLMAGIFIDCLLFYVFISLHFLNAHRKKQTDELANLHNRGIQSLAEQTRLVEAMEQESNTFFEIAPDALLVVTAEGIIARANQRAHDVFEYAAGELIGNKIDNLVSLSIRASHAKLRAIYAQKPSSRLMGGSSSLQAVKKDGSEFQVVVNLVPIEFKGKKHTVAAVHDVTEQRVAEFALAQAKENAELANRSKSEFLANMSHEIRTPLNAVLGSAQLLERTQPTPAQKKYVNMIRGSGESLLGIINDILDFSKIEAGRMELSKEQFNLNELLDRLSAMMSVNAGEKDLQLEIYVTPSVFRHLIGDALRLQQVLINLTSNAIKFTATGNVKVCIDGELDTKMGTQILQCTVSDTGIGMTGDQQSLLFQAFSQTDTSITRRFGGSGLGLVISSRIVDLMGGRIYVASQPGIGSTFGFTITLAAAQYSESSPFSLKSPARLVLCSQYLGTAQSLTAITQAWGWDLIHLQPKQLDDVLHLKSLNLTASDFIVVDIDHNESPIAEIKSTFCAAGASANPFVLLLSNWSRSRLLDDQFELNCASLVKPVCALSLADVLNTSYEFQHNGESILTIKQEIATGQHTVSGVNALLVEDNVINQTIAIDLLADLGIGVTIANNGREAIDCYEKNGPAFSIILMDVQMPVMDGVTATKILKTQYQCKLPIIAMTAGVLESERKDYSKAGMDGFVAKPIDSNELNQEISRCLSANAVTQRALTENPESFRSINGQARERLKLSQSQMIGSEHHQDISRLDVLNVARLDALTKGRSERVARLCLSLQSVIDSGMKPLVEAEVAVIKGDLNQAKFSLHSLKGVAGNYGADQLHGHIQNIEVMIEYSELANLAGEIDTLKREMNSFMAKAADWIDKHKSA